MVSLYSEKSSLRGTVLAIPAMDLVLCPTQLKYGVAPLKQVLYF